MIEIHLDRKRFLEGFFLTRTPLLKFTKTNKDLGVYALYLDAIHLISQAKSKALKWLE